ncbi:hypothetical protein [Methylomagnum sp.]
MLTGSVLGFCFIPDRQRAALAAELASYHKVPKSKQTAIRRRVARWIVFGRTLNWLVGRIAAFVWVFAEGGLAGVVANAA